MTESQVYKWFWEQRHKKAEKQDVALVETLKDYNQLSDEQKFDMFVSKVLR